MKEIDSTLIKQLLDRFYSGSATADEEARLRQYFSGDNTDPQFDDDKIFIISLSKGPDVEVPSDLEQRLSQAIDSWQLAEVSHPRPLRRKRSLLRPVIGIAASIALLVGLGLKFYNPSPTVPADTFSDPAEAYAETRRVLTLFANTVDKSMTGLQTAQQSSEKAMSLAFGRLNKI